MSTFESFLPHSRYDVPVHPFLPGMKWENTQEMVEDVFKDLKLPWVQDFMLRSHPRQDVHAINDPSNYKRAVSGVLDYKSIPHLSGGLRTTTRIVRLTIPVISIDNIGVGVALENSKLQNSLKLNYLKRMQFSRVVCNNKEQSRLVIRFMEDIGKVAISFLTHGKNGLWVLVDLQMEYAPFLDAFKTRTSSVDFHLINRSITQIIVGAVPLRPTQTVKGNPLYPNKAGDFTGDYLLRNIICAYSDGQLVKATPIFANCSFNINYNAQELRRMQNWGISDRLRHLPVSLIRNPKMSITGFLLNQDLETEECIVISNNETGHSASISHAQISAPQVHPPFPTRSTFGPSENSVEGNKVVTIAPCPQLMFVPRKMGDERDNKKELRKIRNRAARSYQRKLVEKKARNET